MLVLARKVNESIIINDTTEIMIVEIKGDQVKLGIKAPKEIKVYRGEIYKEIQSENIAAAAANPPENLDDLIVLKKKKP